MHAQIAAKRKPIEVMCRMVTDSGFEVATVKEDSFSFRYVDGSAMLSHFLIRLAFLPGFLSILDEAQKDAVFEVLEIRLNEMAFSQGELRLTIPFVCLDCRKS